MDEIKLSKTICGLMDSLHKFIQEMEEMDVAIIDELTKTKQEFVVESIKYFIDNSFYKITFNEKFTEFRLDRVLNVPEFAKKKEYV